MPTDQRQTLTIAEAAKVLGIGRDAAYAAARNGEIPTLRLGRKILVPVSRLEALLNGEHESQGAA